MLLDQHGREVKSVTTVSLENLADMAGFVRYGTNSGVSVNPNTAVQVPAVICAVRVISEGIGQMPARVIAEDYDGEGRLTRRVARKHWAHKLLAVRPNEFQTSFEFKEYAIIACILDRGFLGIKNEVDGEVREILPLPIGTWSIERIPNTWNYYFRVHYANGTTGDFAPSQVVYMRGPSLDGWQSLPALSAAREAIGLSMALEKQQAKLAGNGGKPSGVLSFAETLKPESRERLRQLWQERFGPNGEGGVAVLDGAAKFESMTMTSVDAQHLETRQFQVEEIARAFRVHPNKLMHSGNQATFASAESFARVHVVDTLGPWMRRFEEVMTRDVLGNKPQLRVDLDERQLLRGDFADQAEFYTKALGAGGHGTQFMTLNEVREEMGLNPITQDWANEIAALPEDPASEVEDDGTQVDQV